MRFPSGDCFGMICFHSIYNHTHEFIKRVCGSPQIPEAPTTTNDRQRKQDPYVFLFVDLVFLNLARVTWKVLTEFIILSMTSAVTVTIAGVVKEAVTILVGVLYLHDDFTWLKGLGLFVIMIQQAPQRKWLSRRYVCRKICHS